MADKLAGRSMFFLPISDDNPTRQRPWISYVILGLCVGVFYWQISLGVAQQAAIFGYGMVPARLFGAPLDAAIPNPVSGWTTLFTSMFMHGGLMHLGGNMLYLWIFSDNVEDSIGRGRFIIFYLLCGLCAAFAQALTDPSSPVPMVGASGAIAGVLGAYLLLHPRANIRCIVGILVFFRVMNVPAFLVLGGWIVLQFTNLGQVGSNVAYVAHIGGFIAGMVLIPFFKQSHVRLFEPAHSKAFSVSRVNVSPAHIPNVTRRKK